MEGVRNESDSIVTTIETITVLEENDKVSNKTLTDFNHNEEIIHFLQTEGGKNWQERNTFVEATVTNMEEGLRQSWIANVTSQDNPSKTHAANHTGAAEPAQEAGTASQETTEAQEESERSGHGAG